MLLHLKQLFEVSLGVRSRDRWLGRLSLTRFLKSKDKLVNREESSQIFATLKTMKAELMIEVYLFPQTIKLILESWEGV